MRHHDRVDAAQALVELGGIASGREICAGSSRRKLRTAVRAGRIQRVARDSYTLPHLEDGAAAARINGVMSHASAAAHWGCRTKCDDPWPSVIVPRGRKVSRERRLGVHVFWRDLRADEVQGRATAPLRTVLDCAADLPFDEALAIADSALRIGVVSAAQLAEAAAVQRGPGSARARRVIRYADPRAMNPFESVLRAQAIEAGLDVTPQLEVGIPGGSVHPDLVDPGRRLILEADSWSFHADKEAHDRDCFRYTLLTTLGWVVLRFTWHQVMTPDTFSREMLRRWAEDPQLASTGQGQATT